MRIDQPSNYFYKVIAFIFICFLFHTNSEAQKFIGDIQINDSEQIHLIFLKNGKVKEGRIVSIENTELTFLSLKDERTIHHLADLSKVMVKGAVDKKHDEYDELATRGLNRLFYQETGFSLPSGTTEYTTYLGIIHKFDYALSNGFTIGAGLVYPGYFTFHMKANLADARNSRRFRMGLNFDLAARPFRKFDIGLEKETIEWRGYMQLGLYTGYGHPDRNIHVALNLFPLFTEGETFGDAIIVSLNYGGTLRVAKHWRIIYESALGGLESNNLFIEGIFHGIGISYFDKRNVVKFAMKPNSNFGFFNVPLSDINLMHRLPILSFSRIF